jgi:WD40 repeat protein
MRNLVVTFGALGVAACLSCGTANAWFAMNTTRLDLVAGPAGTGVLISPDGTRILHLGAGSRTCMLELKDLQPTPLACKEDTVETRPRGAEDMFWSPDSAHLVMPTFTQSFFEFRDTDIRLFDPVTLEVTNLTDDGPSDVLPPESGSVNYDIASRWVDDDTIAFIRYVVPSEGLKHRGGPTLMTIDIGGEPNALMKLAEPDGAIIYTLAVSADGEQFAYNVDDRPGDKGAGLYIVDATGGTPERILKAAEVGTPPTGLSFSADGRYLLLLSPGGQAIDARVLDLETGAIVPVGDGEHVVGVAWSPTGAALAYVSYDTIGTTPGGLFVSDAPGEPGMLLVAGDFLAPLCCGRQPFLWANDNTMLLGRVEDLQTVLLVTLGGP